MIYWRTRAARLAVAGVLAGACVLGALAPALAADAPPPPPNSDDWGTIVPNLPGPQADAWIVRVKGFGGIINSTLFESHDPPIPAAPNTFAGAEKGITIPGLGIASGISTRALRNKLPSGTQGGPDVPYPGAAYARAEGGLVDIGFPYIPNPIPGMNQPSLSPLGFHADGIQVELWAKPGKPLTVKGAFGTAWMSMFGVKVVDAPAEWPENTVVRIPSDYSQPPVALAGFKEIVTTNNLGQPTLDAKGHYIYSRTASSGYENAGHASMLGTNAADVTVGHAAVLLGPPVIVPAAAAGGH